jgi:prepilin-type processing-associated H-X9-DG protein
MNGLESEARSQTRMYPIMPKILARTSKSQRRAEHTGLAPGLTVLELLVSMGVISTLMTLLLPAIQASREAARHLECQHHLHQIGLALQEYHDLQGSLPAGWHIDATGDSAYGWAVPILAQLEEGDLGHEILVRSSITTVSPLALRSTPQVYLCPSDTADPAFELFEEEGEHETEAQESREVLVALPHANYIGVFGTMDPDDIDGSKGDGIFIQERTHRWSEVTRGLSHVMIIGERTARKLPSTWLGVVLEGEDATGRIVGYADVGPNRDDADECEFDSRHPGHVNFLWCDGHVDSTTDGVDPGIYRASAQLD